MTIYKCNFQNINKKIKIKKCTRFKFDYENGLQFICTWIVWTIHKKIIMYMKGFEVFQID